MANLTRYYIHSKLPHGFWGRRVLKVMNGKQHQALPEWVFAELQMKDDARVLDVGCGGGANIARILERCPNGVVTGQDRSQLALDMTHELNYRAVVDKKCFIIGGNVNQLPCAKERFDVVTAFETTYFWHLLDEGLEEIHRVLKPGGMCVIANELDGLDPKHKKLEREASILVYTIEEISEALQKAGFTDINGRHDEARHFICVTAHKPE